MLAHAQDKIAEVAALLSLGAAGEEDQGRALLRLDLALDLDDVIGWGQHCACKVYASTAAAGRQQDDKTVKDEAIKALRAALVSYVYASSTVLGFDAHALTVRVIRLHALSPPQPVSRVSQPREAGPVAETAGETAAEAMQETGEAEVMAKSYALLQLSWSADSKVKAALGHHGDLANASDVAAKLCGDDWLRSSANELYGSVILDARTVSQPHTFLLLSLTCDMHDRVEVSDDDFGSRLCDDVASALAVVASVPGDQKAEAAVGPATVATRQSVVLVKVSPSRSYAVLDLVQFSDAERKLSTAQQRILRESGMPLLKVLEDETICKHTSKWVTSVVTMRGHVPPLLPGQRNAMKVFNSSTFSDMHCERDMLNAQVYPALRSAMAKRRIDFSWIDFRWGGVTESDTKNKLGVLRCLQKIDECNVPLQEGVVLPLVVALVGERCGWVPAADSEERAVAAQEYPWTLPRGEACEYGGQGKAFPLRDDYSKYSVTGLEMALAHLRFPHAAECFFFLRSPDFMQSETWKDMPKSAALAFVDVSSGQASGSQPLPVPAHLGPHDSFNTHFLRELVQARGAGRATRYPATLASPPYAFSTTLILSKLRESVDAVQEQEELLACHSSSSPPPRKDDQELLTCMRQALSWWHLLLEQNSHPHWKHCIADLHDFDGYAQGRADKPLDATPAGHGHGDGDGDGDSLPEGQQRGGQESEGGGGLAMAAAGESRAGKVERVVREMQGVVAELQDRMAKWRAKLAESSGEEGSALGNTNVAAAGVKLEVSPLAWGVMMNLIDVLDTCFPEPSRMPADAHVQKREAQARLLEDLSASFVCLQDGSRQAALAQLDALVHPPRGLPVEHLVALVRLPSCPHASSCSSRHAAA